MKLYRNAVRVGTTTPPEEILTSICGNCGLWQLCVYILSFFTVTLYGMDHFAGVNILPNLRYICADGNGSKCFDINGSRCKNFQFSPRGYNLTTFTEIFLIVCEKDYLKHWYLHTVAIARIISVVLVGISTDRYGIRTTMMVFITIQFFSELLVIDVKSVPVLFVYGITHSLFKTVLYLCPMIAVCDYSGNNLRTLILGLLRMTLTISSVGCTYSVKIFRNDIRTLLIINAFLPLLLLIPLLYYKDSPNYICLMLDFSKAEKVLRQIGEANRRPLSPEARIRPVQLITDKNQPKQKAFLAAWKSKKIRKTYLSLIYIRCSLDFNWFILEKYFPHFGYLSSTYAIVDLIGNALTIVLLHVISHRILIAILSLSKSVCIIIVFACNFLLQDKTILSVIVIAHAGAMLMRMCSFTLLNLAPRIFPTEHRTLHLALYTGISYLSTMVFTIITTYTPEKAWFIVSIVTMIPSPFLETLCSLFLWNVHKRELPDFVVDCERFQKYYKPTRYCLIYDLPSEHEIEVKKLVLDKDERREQRRNRRNNT